MNDSQIQSLLNAICFQNPKCRKRLTFLQIKQTLLLQCTVNQLLFETTYFAIYLR